MWINSRRRHRYEARAIVVYVVGDLRGLIGARRIEPVPDDAYRRIGENDQYYERDSEKLWSHCFRLS
jgi:hypothetical protein